MKMIRINSNGTVLRKFCSSCAGNWVCTQWVSGVKCVGQNSKTVPRFSPLWRTHLCNPQEHEWTLLPWFCWLSDRKIIWVGLTQICEPFKSREFSWLIPSQRFKRGGSDPQLIDLEMEGATRQGKRVASKNWERVPADNQQGNGAFSSTTAKSWILPTRRKSLEAYFL